MRTDFMADALGKRFYSPRSFLSVQYTDIAPILTERQDRQRRGLDRWTELTFLTKKEILVVFDRFVELDPCAVRKHWNVRLPKEKVLQLDELRVNPFSDRMCDVFSSSLDGDLSFEDFLEMMSAFSEKANRNVKIDYAFKIYDFDGDNMISRNDMMKVIDCLTGDQWMLTDDKLEIIIDLILSEADLDGDGLLSFAEFQHVMSKSPDFMSSFCIRL